MAKWEKYFDEFQELLMDQYCLSLRENKKVFEFIYNAHAENKPVQYALDEFAQENLLIKKK